MNKKIPTYKISIEDNVDDLTGVTAISLVEAPAIEVNFLSFSTNIQEQNVHVKFEIKDKEKRIVSGPILIPDFPIYRKKGEEEYYLMLDKETIYKIAQKFFKTQRINSINADHSTNILNGCYMFESFVIDKDRGIKAPDKFEYLTDGTWFGSIKVDNDEIWDEVKKGSFKGFSIEGTFDYIVNPVEEKMYKTKPNAKKSYKDIYQELKELLEQYFEEVGEE